MNVTLIVPLLAAIIGLLVFVLAGPNAKAAELGRIAFFCGLLVTLLVFAQATVSIR